MRLWWSLSELHHSLIFFRVPGKRANRGSGSSGLRLKSGSGGVVTSGLFVSVKSSRLWRFSYCTDPIQSICTPAVGGRTLCHPILHWSWRFPLQQAQDTMVSLRNGIVSMCVPGQVWGHSNSEVLGLESMAMETCNWWILFRGPSPKTPRVLISLFSTLEICQSRRTFFELLTPDTLLLQGCRGCGHGECSCEPGVSLSEGMKGLSFVRVEGQNAEMFPIR